MDAGKNLTASERTSAQARMNARALRIFRSFPQNISSTPRFAHGRTDDLLRERLTRPMGATPRRAQDWQ